MTAQHWIAGLVVAVAFALLGRKAAAALRRRRARGCPPSESDGCGGCGRGC